MIEARGLTKSFGPFQALAGIDLNVHAGEVYGFLGHNGAGKSTTMNILTGFSRPDAGTCRVNGWDLAKIEHPGDLHIGYLSEEPRFYTWMTGRETLLYLGSHYPGDLRRRVSELLDWVGLSKAANRRVGGYSRGMKQRLGMAAALFFDPELLFLDEPSSALDPEGRSDVLNLILDLKSRGKTVFISTHILSDVERVCDRVGILSHGRMVLEKGLKELLSENVKPICDLVLSRPTTTQEQERIRQLPGVSGLDGEGETLAAVVEEPQATESILRHLLGIPDLRVQSFAMRRASLENIFLEEVGKGAV